MKSTIVVGAGYWGRNYIKELGLNCIAVIDPDKNALLKVASNYNYPCFTSVEELVRLGPKQQIFLDDIEYIIIATPPENHISYAHHFASLGKYVLVEKPFCLSSEEGIELLKYKDKIMVGHIYTYHQGIQELKDKLYTVPIHHIFCRRTNDGPVRTWQNALFDLAPHDISICNFLLDQSPISYDIMEQYDYAVVRLEYVACQALIYVSWLGGPKVRQVELVPAQSGDRIIFDDLTTVYEVSPMRLMLNAFFNKSWNKWCGVEAAIDMIRILES